MGQVDGTRTHGWVVPARVARPLLAAEVVLAAVLGSIRLGHKSLWYDEGFSAMASTGGVGTAIDVARHVDSNMPLYLVGLSVWRVVGDGEVALRSFSVAAAAGAVVSVYLLSTRLFDRATGLVAGFLLAVAPFVVRYAQEARGYALLVLLATTATWLFVSAVETRRTPWFVAYAVVAAAACYAHLAAVFVIAGHAASLLLLPRRDLSGRRLAATAVGIGVLLLPLAAIIRSATDSLGVYEGPTVGAVPRDLASALGGWPLAIVLAATGAVTVRAFAEEWGSHRRSLESWRLGVVLTGIAVPFVGLLASAAVLQRNWSDRYLIVLLPFVVVAAAFAIVRLRHRAVAAGILVVVLTFATVEIVDWYRSPALEDFRALTARLLASSTPEDGVVFCDPILRVPTEYYLLRVPEADRPRPLSPTPPWGPGIHFRSAPAATAREWADEPARIWVVRSRGAAPTGACDLDATLADRDLAQRRTVDRVVLERYDR